MSEIYNSELAALATSLSELVVKGTVSAISSKIRSIKTERDINRVHNVYNEIINKLLSEREEAVRIAQQYKSELEKVVISDSDIQKLHNTVSRILEIIKQYETTSMKEQDSKTVKEVKKQVESYEKIKELISVDTIKAMQLLGFNYKSAIGEPLTLMLRNFILSKVKDPDPLSDLKKFATPEMVEILKDQKAYDNLIKFFGLSKG